jgi:hypothetical protein
VRGANRSAWRLFCWPPPGRRRVSILNDIVKYRISSQTFTGNLHHASITDVHACTSLIKYGLGPLLPVLPSHCCMRLMRRPHIAVMSPLSVIWPRAWRSPTSFVPVSRCISRPSSSKPSGRYTRFRNRARVSLGKFARPFAVPMAAVVSPQPLHACVASSFAPVAD